MSVSQSNAQTNRDFFSFAVAIFSNSRDNANSSNTKYRIRDYWDKGPKDIVIPDSLPSPDYLLPNMFNVPVGEIMDKSFREKGLKTVVIPNTIKKIGYEAFYGNNLTEVTVEETVPPALHATAFENNPPFSLIVPQQSIATYKEHATWKHLKPKIKPSITFNLQNEEFTINEPISLNATSNSGGKIVYSIEEGGTATASLYGNENVILEASSFGTVKVKATVLEKGDYVTHSKTSTLQILPQVGSEFMQNDFVYKVTGNSPYELSVSGYTANEKEITIPGHISNLGGDFAVTAVEKEAFFEKGLKEVVISAPVSTIGEDAFGRNELTKVILPESLLSIGPFAFEGNKLTTIALPNSVTTIGNNAFATNSLSSIILPDALTSLEEATFSSNKFTEVVIPENITDIEKYVFLGNNELTKVTLPKSLKRMDSRVFPANSVEKIITHATVPPTITSSSLGSSYLTNLVVVVPEGSLSAYKNNTEWDQYFLKGRPTINFEDTSIAFSETIPLNATSNSGGTITYEIVQGGTTTASLSGTNNQVLQPTILGSLHVKAKVAASGDYVEAEKTSVITLTRRNEFVKAGVHYKISEKWSGSLDNVVDVFDYTSTDTELVIPKQVTDLGISYYVVSIDDNAFKDKQIEKISIPNYVFKIRENAFQNTLLSQVTLEHVNPPEFASNTFSSTANFKLQVPSRGLELYKNSPWAPYLPKIIPGVSFSSKNIAFSEHIPLNATTDSKGRITYAIVSEGTTAEASLSGENNEVLKPESLGDVVIKVMVESDGDYLSRELTQKLTITPRNNFTKDGFTYKIITDYNQTTRVQTLSDEVILEGYSGEDKEITIPETVTDLGNNYTVYSIGNSAFYDKSITKVNMPNTIKEIGQNAFMNNHLEEVVFPNSVRLIRKWAFANNKITQVDIPSSISVLYAYVFKNNLIEEVRIPNQISGIWKGAFHQNPITRVFVEPFTPPNLFDLPFDINTDLLVEVSPESLQSYKSVDFWKDYFPKSVPNLNFNDVSKTFSETIELNASSESNGEITYSIVPGGTATAALTGERNQILNPTSLGTLHIKANIAANGDYLAADATAIYTILNRTEFEKEGIVYAVTATGPTPTVEVIAYTGSSREVTIPSSVEDVGLAYTVTGIGSAAFFGSDLSSISLPDSITKIGSSAFKYNNLTSISLPNSLTHISAHAFAFNNFTAIALPNSLAVIENWSFNKNKLQEVTIPSAVSSIGPWAFANNPLERVLLNGTVPPSLSNYFYLPSKLEQVLVPFSSVNAYWEDSIWEEYTPQATPNLTMEDFSTSYGEEESLPTNSSFSTSLSYKVIEGGSGKAVLSSDNHTLTPTEAGTVLLEITSLESERYVEVKDTITATILKKPITIEALATSKFYGDTDAPLPLKIDGEETNTSALNTTFFLNGNDQLSGALTRAAGEDVGEYAITSTLAHPNYDITYTGAMFSIQKKEISITADTLSKHYGDEDPEFTYTVSPTGINLTSINGTLTREAGENVGVYSINSSLTSNNFNINFTPAELTITKKPVTVKAVDKEHIYGEALQALTYEVSPSLSENESLDVFMYRGSSSITPDRYLIHMEGNNPNYDVTWEKGIYTIKKKPLTITANPISQIYDAAEKPLTYSFSENLVGDDALTGSLSRETGNLPGTYKISSTLSHPNYDITFNQANYVIAKKSISLTADAKTKVYGEQDPVLTYTLSTALMTGVSLQGGLTREAGNAPGSYEIRSNISHPLYDITYIPADLTITKKPITITAESKTVVYGEDSEPLTYTLSENLVGTDNLVGQLERETRETVGTYPITSTLAHPGYSITYVGANYEITKKPITITAEDKTIFYGDTDVELTFTTEPAISSGDEFTGELSRATGKEVGEYLISSTLANPNYDITFKSGKYTIANRAITIKADNIVKKYGQEEPELTYSVSPPLVGNDELTGSLTRASGEDLGDYQITSTLANDEYDITFEPGTFSIIPENIFEIDGFVFEITSVTSPYTVKLTGANFPDPEITEITIPNTVENSTITYTVTGIGNSVFVNMQTITKVNLPNQLRFIGESAFQETGINSIVFPASLEEIHSYAFRNSNLEEVILTDNIRKVGAGAFENNNLATVRFPEQLENIESEAFAGNKLTEIDLPDALNYIQPASFKNNLLSKVSLPNQLVSIGDEAFAGNELTELALPKFMMQIGQMAFAGNKFKHLMVSNELMMLGREAFNQTQDEFEYIVVNTPEPPLIEDGAVYNATFGNNQENIKVLVPTAQLNRYKNDPSWSVYQLEAIPEINFQDTSVTFGETLNLEASILDVKGDFEFFIEKGGTGLASLAGTNNSVLSTNRAGEVLVKVIFTEANGYYQLEKTSTITITKRDIDVIANSSSKLFGEEDPELTYEVKNLLNNDLLDGELYRTSGEQVGTYEIKSALSSPNYTINFETSDFIITKKNISIKVPQVTKIYGEEDPEIIYQLPSGYDWIDLDDIKGTLTREAGEDVGTYIITSSLESKNFDITTVIEDFKILPRPITLTADESSKIYGEEDPVFSYSLSEELLNEDNLKGELTRVLGEEVGSYAIESTLQNPNYDIDFVSKNLTITPKTIFVFADASTKTYGEEDPELTYSLSEPLLNNQVLQGSLSREAGENVGTYRINGSFSNANYDVDFLSSEFTITKKQISASVPNTKVYGEADPEFSYTLSSELIGNDRLTGTVNRAAGEDVGAYAFISTLENSNYNITLNSSEFIITPKPITVTGPNTKMYGEPDPEFNYTLSDELIGNDSLTGVISRTPGEDVGTYALTSTLENRNYSITLTSSEFTITPKLITATVSPNSKVYGDEEPTLTYEWSEFPLATDTLTINLSREAGEDVGTYTLTSSTNNENYNIALSSSEFRITPKPITATLFTDSKVYGKEDPELLYTLSKSLIGTDTLSGSLTREAGEDVGTYAILNNLENKNYTIDFTSNTFEITKASQVITFHQLEAENTVGETIVLTAQASSGLSVSYTSSNESIATVLEDKLTFTTEGTVLITASQDGNGNYKAAEPVSQELKILTLSVLDETFNSEEVIIYPNPSNTFIKIKGIEDLGHTVSIFNSEGRFIKKVSNYTSNNKIIINNLQNGTYILKITKENNVITKKFLKI